MSHIKTIAAAIALLFAFGLTVPASADNGPVAPGGTKKQDKDAKKFNKETDKAIKKQDKAQKKADKKAGKDEKKGDKKDDKKGK